MITPFMPVRQRVMRNAGVPSHLGRMMVILLTFFFQSGSYTVLCSASLSTNCFVCIVINCLSLVLLFSFCRLVALIKYVVGVFSAGWKF